MNKKNCSKYTPEQRLMIIKEFELGTMTAAEVAQKNLKNVKWSMEK